MLKNITILLVGSIAIIFCVAFQVQKSSWVKLDFNKENILEKMAYASADNFMKQQIYPCESCYLRPEVHTALLKASKIAQSKGCKIVIFDCYRPKQFQQKMFEIVNNPNYVAKPTKGSMHNKGLAIDLSLADSNGNQLDMGTVFDDFSEKANYNCKSISTTAKNNRKLLRNIMLQAGFEPYENEWWHFNFRTVNYPADDFVWKCN